VPRKQQKRPIARKRGLSKAEMAKQQGSELPDREAMSLVNANLALPINAAVAANVLSDNAIAAANAQQDTPINQGMLGQNPVSTT
jgi:hypothetical protein